MKEDNTLETKNTEYQLILDLDDNLAGQLNAGYHIRVDNYAGSPEGLHLRIQEKERFRGGFAWVIRDFKMVLKAVVLPLKNSIDRAKLFTLAFVYTLFTPSGLAVFFIRGWRLDIISRMTEGNSNIAVAPSVQSLRDVGEHIHQGVRLFAAKAAYDLPKLVVLVAVGYDKFELIIQWSHYVLDKALGGNAFQGQTFSDFANESAQNFSMTLGLQLVFLAIYSLFFTPAFRITMIKYARGKIAYKRFFSWEELKDSFRIYRRYKIKTIEAYFWDLLVSGLSFVFGLILIVAFPVITWLFIPFYKLLFKHWPKAYGYGLLGRKLRANGEV